MPFHPRYCSLSDAVVQGVAIAVGSPSSVNFVQATIGDFLASIQPKSMHPQLGFFVEAILKDITEHFYYNLAALKAN